MKINLPTSLKKLAALLALPAISILSGPQAHAAPFTYGNIAVLQEGDGVHGISTTSAPVTILEYTPAGTLVQSIGIPSSGVGRLTQSSASASEGFLTRSSTGTTLTFVGYDADAGATNVPASAALNTNRGWGQLDASGTYTRGLSGSATAFSASNIRSSASDGTSYWMAGTAGSSANQGIWYSASGAAWIQLITATPPNTRVVKIFNGKLYYSTSTAISGYPGLPTAAAAAPPATGIASSSIYDFAINASGTVAYVCDDSVLTSVGGIQKWTNSGSGTWVRTLILGTTNGLTAGCRALAVDFSGPNPIIYATTGDATTKVIEITDTSAFTAITNTTDKAITLAVAANNTFALRGVALVPGTPAAGAPVITGISPTGITNTLGSTDTFAVTANGTTPLYYYWYKEILGTSTNLVAGATNEFFTIRGAAVSDTASYQVVVSNSSLLTVTSAVVSLVITSAPPSISNISPLSTNVTAGATVQFVVTAGGNPPLNFAWYKEILGVSTNLIAGATTATLTLTNVLGPDAVNYQVVVGASGSSVTVTSAVVSVTVTGDPHISSQPASTYGLLDGTVYFHVGVVGTTPSYQWYYSDGNGGLLGMVTDGTTTPSGVAVVSGSTSSTLSIANVQASDLTSLTNLVAVVSNPYGGPITSSPASLLSINATGVPFVFWDFNGFEFTNTANNPSALRNPVPYLGAGTAGPVGSVDTPGTSPFAGSVDPNNGFGFDGYPAYVYPPTVTGQFGGHANGFWFSWGSSAYPLTGGNKQNGVQFNVSTVGIKNVRLSYESRVSATASDYERVQFTTNGTDWIDFPTSATFGGVGTTYLLYTNDFTGFPGVANNPNFGVRIVTEYQSTATYGVGTTNTYVGTANAYGTTGTVTYDVVTFFGDAVTNNNAAPVVAGFMDTNTLDYVKLTNNFTVSDDTTPVDNLTYSAVSLDTSVVNPTFTFTGSGPNRTLIITPNTIPVSIAAAPILVTITDTNGDSTASWFVLTLTSSNLPPTNTLTLVKTTNTLANTALTIPFIVGDDHTTNINLTDFTVSSDNNTLIPAANIVVTPNAGTPSVTITPAHNQLGVAVITITLNDDDVLEPKSTTASIAFTVRPNTNVIAIDYFTYDGSGALDSLSLGFWNHLSGNFGQMKVNVNGLAPNTVSVDATAFTENLITTLLGSPYKTNNGVLYASYTVNLTDVNKLPLANGTYVTAFNDGASTANVQDLLVVSTNNAALGNYRLGIGNATGATALTSTQFPLDLIPGTNYVVVTALNLTNGVSTLWINPGSPSSGSVTDNSTAASVTNGISAFELRESGQPNGGLVSIGSLKVGTSFDAVLPAPHVQIVGTNAVITWSDPTIGLKATTDLTMPFLPISGATTPYTNALSPLNTLFFQLGQ